MNKLDEIIKSLKEIDKNLTLEELNEFVEELDSYLSGVRFRLELLNREDFEDRWGY